MDVHDLLSVASDSLSHVTGGMLYFMFPDALKALRETNRVLMPWESSLLPMARVANIDALRDAVEKVRPGTNLTLLPEAWTSEAGVKGQLTTTGFVDVETHLVESSISYQSPQQLVELLLLMPVMKNMMQGFSEKEMADLLLWIISRL